MARILCVLLLFGSLSCSKDDAPGVLIRISSGVSYGFCVGYCEHELEIEKEMTVFAQRPTRQQDLVDLVCTQTTNPQIWSELENVFTPEFFDLAEVIGCPDCVDQGREFIEIETLNRKHRIELDPSLEAIFHPIIQKLREIRTPFIEAAGCPE